MSRSPSTVATGGTRAAPCARLARGDVRASSDPRTHPVRPALRRSRGRRPPTRWRSASDDAASLVPPLELEALADASSLETVDPTVDHVDKAACVWYVPSFLDADTEAAVAKCCEKLRAKKKMKPDKSFALGRRAAMVPVVSDAYAVFSGARVSEQLRSLTDCGKHLRCGDFPIEARLYLPGAQMAWHRDVRLYETPQLELIFTVANDGDGKTQWVGSDGAVRSIRPEPNSVLLFAADGAWHRVVPATKGERTIVKALYCPDGNTAKTPAFGECLENAPWRR